MPEVVYHHKLVRDKVPARIAANGELCQFRRLHPEEFLHALIEKLAEESQELRQALDLVEAEKGTWGGLIPARERALKEIVDLQLVIDEIVGTLRIETLELIDAKCKKRHTHGDFSQRIYLESTWRPE